MTMGKRTSLAAVAVLFIIYSSYKDGVSGAGVDVLPRNPILKIGQNFTFKCSVGTKLQYCRIQLPGRQGGFNLHENSKKNSDYWYEGSGLSYGQCGIGIAHISDEHNGPFQCTMGTPQGSEELVGTTNVTVARPPRGSPDLFVSPEPDRMLNGAYREDTTITAKCTVRDARPKASLSWYIGDDQVTDGVGREDVTETQGNLYTVSQNFTRRLTWKDSAKNLRCEANHPANDMRPLSTTKQISVVFPPRSRDRTIEKFGLVIGEDDTIAVQIQANPRPAITWFIDLESVGEGRQDSTQRFTVTPTRSLGNDTWETSLTIAAVSAEDVNKKYSLKARNEIGEQSYRVAISTEDAPEGSMLELGTGPIIGIVVAILVLLIVIFMLIFARATGRWCFSGAAPPRHDNKESSDTESADHGPTEKSKKPKMNLTYILKKKKDKVAADEDDLKLQTVAMENEKVLERPGTESSEHIATPIKGKTQGQDVVYAELDLQATQRPIVRREDEKTEYAEIIHTNPTKGDGGTN